VTWTFALILVPTLCYAGAMVMYLLKGDYALALVYSGYSWANLGLLWLDWARK
jgi:hypothetical protein